VTSQESKLEVIKNYASAVEKLTPDNEPDLVFLGNGRKTVALCEVKTPCMIKAAVFDSQLKKFALRCERANAPFYLCVPAQSLGAALVLIAESKVFQRLIKRKLLRLFAFTGTPENPTAEIEEVQL
jgi:hypothetical protein